jgi:hypothetical protein
MTSQNQSGKDAETLNTPKDDTAPKATETAEVTRELTDDEIAAVAGGGAAAGNGIVITHGSTSPVGD